MAGMNPSHPLRFARAAFPAAAARAILAVLWATAAFAQTYYWNPSPAGGGEAQKTQNWTSQANGGGFNPPSVSDDDFEDTLMGPWTYLDMVPDNFSSASFSSNPGRLTILSRGVDVWDTVNQLTAVYRADIKGNFDVSVKIVSQTAAFEWSKAGILVANNFLNFANGGMFSVETTPGHGVVAHYDSVAPQGYLDYPRNSPAAPRLPYPHWLRITRVGKAFTAYSRTDSTAAWTPIGSAHTPLGADTGASSHIGLFVTSHNTAVTCTTVFDDFRAGGAFAENGLDLSFNGTGSAADSNATLGGPLSARSVDFTGYTGTFSFGSAALSLTGDANFASAVKIVQGTGRLVLSGTSGGQQLTPKAADTLPTIWKTGASTARIVVNPLLADSLHLAAGTFDLNGMNAHLQQFTASGGALTGFTAADTLFVYSRADFSGLQTLTAGLGTVAIKAVGNGKTALFNPAGHVFNHVTLWTVPTGTSDAFVRVGPGGLVTAGDLVFRSQKAAATVDGITDFATLDPDVTVGGNISQIIEGSAAQNNWFPIRMGNGTWKAGGNVAFSLYGGSADSSVLELTRASGTQSLRVIQGSGPNPLNRVVHAAAGTVRLDTLLAADSLTLTDGVLDLNGWDISLAGSLNVDGPPGLLANLGGRTLSVAGDAVFLGRDGAPLALDPAAAWTVNASGALTADFADIGNSRAAGSTGMAGAGASDRGGNVNWSFGGGPATQAPIVVREPADDTVIEGQDASFLVSASGHDPKTYSWRRTGDTAVIGTDSVLTLPAAALAQSGSRYRCVVANSSGAATTREARLTVLPMPPAPTIIRQPSDTSIKAGARAVFSVGVAGGAPFQYAWRRSGDTALLSRESLFVIASAAAELDGAEYYVVVSNAQGSDTSSTARLSVRLCDSLVVQVSRDTSVEEGKPVKLWGKANCADRVEWSVVSGPAPRLTDPGVDTLIFPAPRVTRDTAVRYRFTAYSGGEQRTLPVVLRVLEAVPDPDFTLAAELAWNGAAPLVLRPTLLNKARLDLVRGYPLRYLWSLDPDVADTAVAGDSLVLRNPAADGILVASLCLDNGGEAHCDTTRVDVKRSAVSAAGAGIRLAGGLLLSGSRLTWLSAGEARLWDSRGRLLYRADGVPGTQREMPEAARKALGRGARLLFLVPEGP